MPKTNLDLKGQYHRTRYNLRELCATLADACVAGDLRGHLRAWRQTRLRGRPDKHVSQTVRIIFRDDNQQLCQDFGVTKYPVYNVPGYYAVDLCDNGRRVFHVDQMEFI